ncbi:MAG: hypothetical protein CSB33_03125 [Desulfobacterales bacterium]|nr:MAG: hypothetical protein CSB33_03125 [Desulfobacterales bacterium]
MDAALPRAAAVITISSALIIGLSAAAGNAAGHGTLQRFLAENRKKNQTKIYYGSGGPWIPPCTGGRNGFGRLEHGRKDGVPATGRTSRAFAADSAFHHENGADRRGRSLMLSPLDQAEYAGSDLSGAPDDPDAVPAIAIVFGHAGTAAGTAAQTEKSSGASGADKDGRYAVAAVRVDAGGGKTVFSSLIRYTGITAREYHRSGVSDAEAAGAPCAKDVGRSLRKFIGRNAWLFVLDDDRPAESLAEFCGRGRFIDLSFAALFFLPGLKGPTVRNIREYLNQAPELTTSLPAEKGAETGLDLLQYLAGHVLNTSFTGYAPVLRHYLEQSHTFFGNSLLYLQRHFSSFFPGGLFDAAGFDSLGGGGTTDNWRAFLPRAVRLKPVAESEEPCRRVAPGHLTALYQALASHCLDFRVRPEQLAYARHVAEALNEESVLTIEAGTGTGKTQGYLMPVLEFLHRNPARRVVVSTYTKNLQDQIFHTELVRAREALPHFRDIPAALLKGKSSYICAEKLDAAWDERLDGVSIMSWLYALVRVFSFREAAGEPPDEVILRRLDKRGELTRLLRDVCAGTGCTPGHSRCPAQIVTAEALGARLVVTNHHKLALLDRDQVLSGVFRHYIIDEANHFEAAVRNAFAREAGSREIRESISYIESAARRVGIRAGKAGDSKAGAAMALTGEAISAFRRRSRELGEALATLFPDKDRGATHVLTPEILSRPGEGGAAAGEILTGRVTALHDAARRIHELFSFLREKNAMDRIRLPERSLRRLTAALDEVNEFRETLLAIRQNLDRENTITACRLFARHWSLMSQWVEVGGLIREEIYRRKGTIVFTAATIRHNGRFEAFQRIAGMPVAGEETAHPGHPGGGEHGNGTEEKSFRFAEIPSPFDPSRMELVIPPQAVNARYANKERWLETVTSAIPELIRQNRGRTLVLFASYQDMKLIAERTGPIIEADRFPLFIQQPGAPTTALCDEFRSIRESVLFGVDTFWYGIDFKGETLTQVIITRVPYPPPRDPVQAARKKILPAREFWQRYYYDADIKMRQGIGRLIRSDTDYGRVVILDNRWRA